MWSLAQTAEFDHILVRTVQTTFPQDEHERYIAHFRGLIEHWVSVQNRIALNGG